jgi:putative protease
MNQKVELLAPARDLDGGLAAIACGADALYIGAARFGARESAGNSQADIAALTQHAHRYWAKVYLTLNTLLRDDELAAAVETAWQAHEAGIDGLIIQDVGLLECELPPLPLIASTQMHNHTPERVAFLEQAGFQRAILARELDLEQIRAIHKAAPAIELECFVHGALCVCYSGQCGLSYSLGGRSGNRGECAQPCRKRYDLLDADGRLLAQGLHLLSIRDLNLSDHLDELLDAGATSFKVEGRLKDASYVSNIVAHYSARLDALGVRRSSSGHSTVDFHPDPGKTFNRGFTDYFLHGRRAPIGSHRTPKMTGESMGRVEAVRGNSLVLPAGPALHNGDGLCFFDRQGELRGSLVNEVNGRLIGLEKMEGLEPGIEIYRNHDHEFLAEVARSRKQRRIRVSLSLRPGLELQARDEDGNTAVASLPGAPTPATNPEAALAMLRRQLEKSGNTEFVCSGVEVEVPEPPFLPVSAINALRREVLDRLRQVRAQNRPRPRPWHAGPALVFPQKELSYLGNVLNQRAEAFYRRHGVTQIEAAAESGLDMRGRKVMTTRYCIKDELGWCPRQPGSPPMSEPLILLDEEGNRLELHFDCARCEMEIFLRLRNR